MNSNQNKYIEENDDIGLKTWGALSNVSDPNSLDQIWTSIAMNLLKHSERQSSRDAYNRLSRLCKQDRMRIREELRDEVSGQSSPNCQKQDHSHKLRPIASEQTRIVASDITRRMNAIATAKKKFNGENLLKKSPRTFPQKRFPASNKALRTDGTQPSGVQPKRSRISSPDTPDVDNPGSIPEDNSRLSFGNDVKGYYQLLRHDTIDGIQTPPRGVQGHNEEIPPVEELKLLRTGLNPKSDENAYTSYWIMPDFTALQTGVQGLTSSGYSNGNHFLPSAWRRSLSRKTNSSKGTNVDGYYLARDEYVDIIFENIGSPRCTDHAKHKSDMEKSWRNAADALLERFYNSSGSFDIAKEYRIVCVIVF
ncbi:hypothetical protein BGZ80_004899, partial [Entomortierella chlamydospora]